MKLELEFLIQRLKLKPGPKIPVVGKFGEIPGMLNLDVRRPSSGPCAAADPPPAALASAGPKTPPPGGCPPTGPASSDGPASAPGIGNDGAGAPARAAESWSTLFESSRTIAFNC